MTDLRDKIAAVIYNTSDEYARKLMVRPDCPGASELEGDGKPVCYVLADAVIAALEEHQHRETCGGCRGLGGHSPRCHTQPGALWRRLADMAESLGDRIGGNDTTLANRAYDLMVSLRVRGGL